MIPTLLAHADAPLHVHPETLALALVALAAGALAVRALVRARR